MDRFPDYYAVMGVLPTASLSEIRRAYRRRALDTHPDVNPIPDATERFKELSEAYQVLKDPVRRSVYDSFRSKIISDDTPQSPEATLNLTQREKISLVLSGVGVFLRTSIIWVAISMMTFIGGMTIFENGLANLLPNILIIVLSAGACVLFLDAAANTAKRKRLTQHLNLSTSVADVTTMIMFGVLSASLSAVVSVLSAIVFLNIFIPHLIDTVMFGFPIMLSVSTVWFIIETFSRSRATSIQLHKSSE